MNVLKFVTKGAAGVGTGIAVAAHDIRDPNPRAKRMYALAGLAALFMAPKAGKWREELLVAGGACLGCYGYASVVDGCADPTNVATPDAEGVKPALGSAFHSIKRDLGFGEKGGAA